VLKTLDDTERAHVAASIQACGSLPHSPSGSAGRESGPVTQPSSDIETS
jgi:hypothetical protein